MGKKVRRDRARTSIDCHEGGDGVMLAGSDTDNNQTNLGISLSVKSAYNALTCLIPVSCALPVRRKVCKPRETSWLALRAVESHQTTVRLQTYQSQNNEFFTGIPSSLRLLVSDL
jgi:hypothetical protein